MTSRGETVPRRRRRVKGVPLGGAPAPAPGDGDPCTPLANSAPAAPRTLLKMATTGTKEIIGFY